MTRYLGRCVASALAIHLAAACSSSPLSPEVAQSASWSSITTFADRQPRRVIFVTSQGLFFDTFVVQDPLPMHGEFQLLIAGRTEFGPGQAGYLSGRWWEDLNDNGIQDTGDRFFLSPLLLPGRRTP